ncbi:MAG: hypothetical protein M0P32_03685 [Bacteroidales bacterium]|jgi:hypothetical protein|nr:hypothetical protein [Bacteroidales bacterium]MDD2636872.1 hypothetical protein [Bacteroidales bacterium]MDD4217854.1 hypothetical protein [Bacteroidales bacterium]MDY0141953.1 hypothetical protein [Bacteroidales bacterium]
MGKAKNRKRSKILHQRKKERENGIISNKNNTQGLSEIKRRLDKALTSDVQFNYNNNPKGRKISDAVLEMIRPLLKEAMTFDDERNIVGLGVMAWNLGVIKKNKGETEMQKAIKEFSMELPKPIINVLLDYSKIKCENYSEYNELIVDYEFTRLNDNQNNLTVAYKSTNK